MALMNQDETNIGRTSELLRRKRRLRKAWLDEIDEILKGKEMLGF